MLRTVLLTLMLVFTNMAGCLSEKPTQSQFEWPDRVETPCEIRNSEDALACTEYLSGFETPILSKQHPSEPEIWIVDLSGKIVSWDGEIKRNVANLSGIISNCHNEQGLLGMEFTDDFETSNEILVSYVENGTCEGENKSDLILATAVVVDGAVSANSIQILREIDQPYRNHNGGHLLAVGNNQYLWGVGDGGYHNDPQGHGQNASTPLGAIHLFEYQNGTMQPVVERTDGGDQYVLHHGLRNPWRFDLDVENRLWLTDVGQYCWEEINLFSIDEPGNFGWNTREGKHELGAGGCDSESSEPGEGLIDPIHEYGHQDGNCSITGGFWMDWGPSILLDGYLFGDFCSGSIWSLEQAGDSWNSEYIGTTGVMIVGFGKGLDDELLIFSWTGTIYQLSDV